MGTVVRLRPRSLLEFEKLALRKMGDLTELAARLPELFAAIQADGPGEDPRLAAHKFVELLTVLEEGIEALEDLAPHLADVLGPDDRAILQLQCELTKLRITAFATARCSILYVNDFIMEGLDAAFDELSCHRRRMLPPPR
jgi:hypothetical protein